MDGSFYLLDFIDYLWLGELGCAVTGKQYAFFFTFHVCVLFPFYLFI